ncbi:hypothetical protein BRAO375_2840009 [Bradyrhizobium sp. ORS 375]|nr:hypothetical protein BRAO375_2840009 [Bradyrhizobium sp. ORS 375]
MRAQVRPRNSQVPNPRAGILAPLASIISMEMHSKRVHDYAYHTPAVPRRTGF